MSIATFDHNLGLLEMVFWASDVDHLNNINLFRLPTDPGPTLINDFDAAAQITEFIGLYKY